MKWLFGGDAKRLPLKTRLIRNIAPEDVNDVIRDLEDDGYAVVNVVARTVVYRTRQDSELMTIYDILVRGESDPLWGSWGNHG